MTLKSTNINYLFEIEEIVKHKYNGKIGIILEKVELKGHMGRPDRIEDLGKEVSMAGYIVLFGTEKRKCLELSLKKI